MEPVGLLAVMITGAVLAFLFRDLDSEWPFNAESSVYMGARGHSRDWDVASMANAGRYCPNCRTVNETEFRYCRQCTTPLV